MEEKEIKSNIPILENKGSSQEIPPDRQKLSFLEKSSYAMGGVPGAFYTAFTGQIQAFYVAWMFLGPGWILIAQIIYGIWNVVNDPIFGHLQDNTKTKNGRYIPWIKWCAPVFTISFVLIFMAPDSWRMAFPNNFMPSEQFVLFLYYLLTQMMYDTFFTISYCAHTALLPQMTMDPGERTKLSLYNIAASSIGYIMMIVPISLMADPSQANIDFFRILVIIIAGFTLIPWIFVVKFVKERQEFIPESKSSFKENFTNVFKNPSGRMYMIYDGISVAIFQFVMTALPFAFAWIFGLNSAYNKYNPNWGIGNVIIYFIPGIICLLIGIKIQTRITKNHDIKTTLTFCMIMEAIGFFIAFLGCIPPSSADPIVTSNLWLFSIGFAIAMLGFAGDMIYHNPMRADTIDFDEYLTGERSESTYAGVGCIFSKPMISVALAMVPLIIFGFGLRSHDFVDVPTTLYWYSGYSNAIIGVAVAMFLCPSILAVIGVICWQWYPLDKTALVKLRKELDELHTKKRSERLSADGTSKFVKADS